MKSTECIVSTNFLLSHPFEFKSFLPGTINNQFPGVMGGCAFLFGGNLTISERQKGSWGGGGGREEGKACVRRHGAAVRSR